MTRSKTGICAAVCASLFVFAAPLIAQQTAPTPSASSASADNTSMNQRDRASETMKPTDQPNDRTDIKVAAAVRRAILNDKSLSTMAHNVKLVAANGAVTLRGPVANADEKAKVEALTAAVAGVNHVDNQLDIKH
jgi:hyperosmotically inducible protein